MSPVKVLVVEDESIVAMDIKHRLENMDYFVTDIVSSGEEAVKNAGEEFPDLILMDIVLRGEIDGIEAAQIIKDRYNIPIVYLTAYSDDKTLKRAKITGPYGYLIKPFEDLELHSAIEVALYKHQMESKLKESEKWLSTTLESIGEAVITADENGIITFMNPEAQKITGWNDSIGNPLEEIYKLEDEETGKKITLTFDNILKEDVITSINDNILLINRYEDRIPINSTNSPITDDNNQKTGIVIVFHDVTQRRRAEKEREQLSKQKAINELFAFLLSAIPLFASSIPPQIRNNIAQSFADRFEKNIKTVFIENFTNCMAPKDDKNKDDIFNCYMYWLKNFLTNLGIEIDEVSAKKKQLVFSNCPWETEEYTSPMFCLICRIIVIRSFTWTSLKGYVDQFSCVANGNKSCAFQYNLS